MKDGFPPTPYFVFGAVALLGACLDLRMLIVRGVKGPHRLARHLWRMCFAMFIAIASFFSGQAQVFPEPLRNFALLAVPVLLILFPMPYWPWTVLFKRTRSGAHDNAPEQAPPRGAA